MIKHYCIECGSELSEGVYQFSTEVNGYPLCLKHQAFLSESKATPEAITLYLELKTKKLPVLLEYWDGVKTIDIAIPGKLYIEVDGKHHYDPEQALTDFFRSFHSGKEKIPTFRISNAHIHNVYQLEMIVDRLSDICNEFRKTA